MTDEQWGDLRARAEEARKAAHAPYSHYRVGAALLLSDGTVVTGCNVENASYGLTICAERNTMFSAVAATPGDNRPKILALSIATNPGEDGPPCGACRQVMVELAPEAEVEYEGHEGRIRTTVADLLPSPFAPAALESRAG